MSLSFCLLIAVCGYGTDKINGTNHRLSLTKAIQPFLPDNPVLLSNVQDQIERHLLKLEKVRKRQSNDFNFLQNVFFKTHHRFLKRYSPSATFQELFDTGTYGCLSGSALYAIILDHFGFRYTIRELPNHVYLRIHLGDQLVVFESTDPINGFIKNKKQIDELTKRYEDRSRDLHTLFSVEAKTGNVIKDGYINEDISLSQLAGLQYYNMSIYRYKAKDHLSALDCISTAISFYRSQRTEVLMRLVISAILRNELISKEQKEKYLSHYISEVQLNKLSKTTDHQALLPQAPAQE